jgi:hypothetical protein
MQLKKTVDRILYIFMVIYANVRARYKASLYM